jgi:predicted DNA-binding transcriptional regulator YafY
VVLGLRTAAGSAVTGIAEHSVRALAKLEQILPSRVRHRVSALGAAVVPVPWGGGPTVDPAVLIAVASACRDRDRLRFDYTDSAGLATVRAVEPHNLVAWGRRWYLVAWDRDREDWRTFRVDRISPRVPTGPRFVRRDLPAPDAAAFVADRMAGVHAVEHAVLRIHGNAEAVRQWVAARWAEEVVQETDPAASGPAGSGDHVLRLSAGNREELVGYIAMLGADVEVLGPPEVIEHVRTVATRLLRAAGSPRISGSASPWPGRAGS